MTDEEVMIAGSILALQYADNAGDEEALIEVAAGVIARFPEGWPVVVAAALSLFTQTILAPLLEAFDQAGQPMRQMIATQLAGALAEHPELAGGVS